jgi:hypothetical protein
MVDYLLRYLGNTHFSQRLDSPSLGRRYTNTKKVIYLHKTADRFSQDKSPIWSSSIRHIWKGEAGSSISVGICGLASMLKEHSNKNV